MKRKINPIVKLFEPVVDAIAETFGKNCEVVLHDLTDLEHSIVKIANGHITGRKVGDPITDLGLRTLKSHSKDGYLCKSYPTKAKDGRPLKSNSVLIRDPNGNIVGALCINLDITAYNYIMDVISQICSFSTTEYEIKETFENDVERLLDNIINEVIGKRKKTILKIDSSEKEAIIRELEDRGVFMIKGAMKKVSETLGISKVSLYKYLESIRKR